MSEPPGGFGLLPGFGGLGQDPPGQPGPAMARGLRPLLVGLLLVATLGGGCASHQRLNDREPSGQARGHKDPLEPVNRTFFKFNRGVDKFLLTPVVNVYRKIVPKPARRAARNFASNLGQPHHIVNDLLQGRVDRALKNTARFAVNSTLGIGGLLDPASKLGLPDQGDQNFGVTAGVWGAPEGPYLVLPLLGPAHIRGLPDVPLRAALNPATYIDVAGVRFTVTGVGLTGRLDEAQQRLDPVRRAVDPYSFLRSAFRQRQRRLILGPDADPQNQTQPSQETLPFEQLPDDLLRDLEEPVQTDTDEAQP